MYAISALDKITKGHLITQTFLSLFQMYCCRHCGVISTTINSFGYNNVLSKVSVLVYQGD